MGRKFKKEGTHIYPWLIHADIWQKPTQYCKAIILQLKINNIRKKKGIYTFYKQRNHSGFFFFND